jgi:hypothetical protein
MRSRSLLLLAVAALTLFTVASCRQESAQPRSLMLLDDEQRSVTTVSDKPAPLPEEPRPAEWGGDGAPIGMLQDASAPAGAQPPADKGVPMPTEPRLPAQK